MAGASAVALRTSLSLMIKSSSGICYISSQTFVGRDQTIEEYVSHNGSTASGPVFKNL